MNWERIERWQYVVDAVALEYSRKFDMVEIEDLRQTLYQWFAEHPNKLNEWEAKGDKDAKNLIYRSLRNQALDYCQKWKAKSVGYDISDLYYYTSEVIEALALLPPVLRSEFNSAHKLNLGRTGRPSAPAEGGNLTAMMVEVDYVYWKLGKDDRKILFMRHAESMDFKEIANLLSLGSEDASRMRHKRAINRMIRKLGGFKPFPDYDSEDKQEESIYGEEETDIKEETA
jgi:DNA-directed RNA polymerase specialized sigma24 family protein